jgi:RNA polymerase sigma factor (sigma-70 family)
MNSRLRCLPEASRRSRAESPAATAQAAPISAVSTWEALVRGWSPQPLRPFRAFPSAPAPPRRGTGRTRERLPLAAELAPPTTTLSAALRGDRSSWAVVLEPLHPHLVALAGRKIPPGLVGRLDAEDLVQETYLRLLAHGALFQDQGRASFLGWIVRLLENTVTDAVRHHSRQRRSPAREAGPAETYDPRDDRESGRSPLEQLVAQEEHAEVASLFSGLASAERRLLEERLHAGTSFARIALVRGWSEATARRRVRGLLARMEGLLA